MECTVEMLHRGNHALNIDEHVVPRLRRPPERIDLGSHPAALGPHGRDHCKKIFKFLDTIVGTMAERLEKPVLKIYTTIDNTLLQLKRTKRQFKN